MINHKLFVKGRKVYCLLVSYSHPNILIPVKCIIKDIRFNEINPEYKIKIIKFYDSPQFLRLSFAKMSYAIQFGKRARKLKFKPDNKFETHADFLNEMHERERLFSIIVDSIMTFATYDEMQDVFNKIQDHAIEKCLKDIKKYTTRNCYRGTYRIDSQNEYFLRLRKLIGDKVCSENEDRKWIDFTRKL
jgi:hypothetical protein